MKRFLILAAFLFVGTGAASADYLLLKVNLNHLHILPSAQMYQGMGMQGGAGGAVPGGAGGIVPGGAGGIIPGGAGGMVPGGAGGFPPGGGFPGGFPKGGAGVYGAVGGAGVSGAFGGVGGGAGDPTKPKTAPSLFPDDPNAKWVSALVEVNNLKPAASTQYGVLYTADHRWGKNVWLPYSPMFPMVAARVPAEAFIAEFNPKFKKEQKDKNIEGMLLLARWTLSRGQLRRFHEVMDEAAKINEKHINVVRYQKIKKALDAPFKLQDPGQRDLIDELVKSGYKESQSKKGHYGIYAPSIGDDPTSEATIKRRLNLLEDTLETFYYYFALHKDLAAQPALPKHRLMAIVTGSKDDFISRHAQWGSMPKVADGFTPLRDDVIVMSAKPRIDDPRYAELDALITTRLQDANTKLPQTVAKITLTRENLLSGEINTNKEAGKAAMFVGAAQGVILLAKALEDQAERHTVTNEGVRQLLIASAMYPRNVPVPDWIVEGVSALLETPAGGAYPTIGERSCVHLISFKQHRATNKEFTNPADVLQNVISDSFFQKARLASADANEKQAKREDADKQHLRETWEVARCSSWAFIYYLSQQRKLDYLFNYGKELDKLPRDMDLSHGVMQGCFAKAFDMADPSNPQVIEGFKLKNMAAHWFEKLDEANLDNGTLQTFLKDERAKQSVQPIQVAGGPGSNPSNPGGTAGNPNTPPPNLVGTTWDGTEGPKADIKLSIKFESATRATLTSRFGEMQPMVTPANLTQTGHTVTMTFFNGTTSYTGTINGNQLQGKMTTGNGIGWNFSVTNGAAANPNPNPMPPPNPNPMPPPNPNPMPPPNPNPPGGGIPNLINTTWNGTETLPGYGALSFKFAANNQATMTDKDGNVQGVYQQAGNNITLNFKGVIYTGSINGGTMSGNAKDAANNWTWSVNGTPAPALTPPMPMPPMPMPPFPRPNPKGGKGGPFRPGG